MSERAWLIPGRAGPPGAPLARYRPIQPVGAVESYVQRFTRPGDLVVDLFCQRPAIVRETAAAGRRALGFSINPLLLVAAGLGPGQSVGWVEAQPKPNLQIGQCTPASAIGRVGNMLVARASLEDLLGQERNVRCQPHRFDGIGQEHSSDPPDGRNASPGSVAAPS